MNNQIEKVYFRKDESASDHDGSSVQNWHGEDFFFVGETVKKKYSITSIEYFNYSPGYAGVRVYVDGDKIYCEIPVTSVTRVYRNID